MIHQASRRRHTTYSDAYDEVVITGKDCAAVVAMVIATAALVHFFL